MQTENEEIIKILAEDFDAVACEYCHEYKSDGLAESSQLLLDFLKNQGLDGKHLVELGCGPGGFSIECLKHGAASSIGIDLSPEMVKVANDLATSLNLQTRAKFQVGNAATTDIPRADIVVMDKMLCCFPDSTSIFENVISAAGEIIGFIVPRDQGLFKIPLRIAVYLKNAYEKLRNRNLGWMYLHSLSRIDQTLKNAGFNYCQKQVSGFWIIFSYSKKNNSGKSNL
jgi:magnesium-protoporphyrin O-methyltransferase